MITEYGRLVHTDALSVADGSPVYVRGLTYHKLSWDKNRNIATIFDLAELAWELSQLWELGQSGSSWELSLPPLS